MGRVPKITYTILRTHGPDITARRTPLGEVSLGRAREIRDAMEVINPKCTFVMERTTVERVS